MHQRTYWHGTTQESIELVTAVQRNCACEYASGGHRTLTCVSHRMLLDDQRALNGLLFVRQIAPRLRMEELSTERMSTTAHHPSQSPATTDPTAHTVDPASPGLNTLLAYLRELRHDRGVSIPALAERLGIPPMAVIQILSGEAEVAPDVIAKLALALGATEAPRDERDHPHQPPAAWPTVVAKEGSD
jgi:hypothetical protein